MLRYLLDTDHLSLIQYGHPQVSARYHSTLPDEMAASVISYEEQLRGRLAVVSRAATPQLRAIAYERLGEMQVFFCSFQMANFDLTAASIYETLRRTHRRSGKMDLRIAATALAYNLTLVTRNTRDFNSIANLRLDNWA